MLAPVLVLVLLAVHGAAVDLGGRPDWVTFTPDSKTVYIATENTDSVVAVDVASRKEVAKISVGDSPKRNITVTMK